MARFSLRDPLNVEGRWYVDTRCIGCDASRHHAPGLIGSLDDDRSIVVRQPVGPDEEQAMWRAALACPTRSIGTRDHLTPPAGVFPWQLTDSVWLCGHNDRRSFGAHLWFVERPLGNLLVDAPHWDDGLVASFAARGGLSAVLLSHQDDIADAERYAQHFGADVLIHSDDSRAAPFATQLLRGTEPLELRSDLVAIPVPGHTRGSIVYLVDGHLLFTGDTIAWDWRRDRLVAFRDACWYSWSELRESLDRLAKSSYRFDWVLPGHGKWHGSTAAELHDELTALIARM